MGSPGGSRRAATNSYRVVYKRCTQSAAPVNCRLVGESVARATAVRGRRPFPGRPAAYTAPQLPVFLTFSATRGGNRMKTRRLGLALLLLAAMVVPLAAQTTGGIVGRGTDESEAVLPGVTVEATGPALQGTRQAVTDEKGGFRLNLLPPGEYTVTFNLEGFHPQTAVVTVGLNKDTTLNAALRASASEEITVTGEAPVIDHQSASIAQNLTTRQITNLPTGRNYSSVVQVVPGASSDANPENKDQ